MKITIFNISYEDFYSFSCENIEEGRKIVKKENAARGWNDNDCFSKVDEDD